MRTLTVAMFMLLTTLSVSAWGQHSDATIVYVNIGAEGANNGSSWENGYTNLQDALNNPRATQIWVAQGIYTAPKGGFYIDGFGATGTVYGGFKGDETSINQREIEQNTTILERSENSANNRIISSTNKNNNLSFDGFLLQTTASIETPLDAIENCELSNCWINNEPFDNSSEFANKSSQNEPINKLAISQIGLENDSTVIASEDFFKVHPTNTTSSITVTAPKGSTIQIINYLGRMVKQVKLLDNESTIDISNQTKGLYIVKLITPERRIKTERIFLN